jgi:DNA-binding CsgD family transcriptional regulator
MFKQKIHIINFKTLFDILEEIKSNFSFEIFHHNNEENFIDFINSEGFNNSLVLTKTINKKLVSHKYLDKRQIIQILKKPLLIINLIEDLNIKLIKQRYNFQSSIKIKDYILNFNSRLFLKDQKQLKLTQREIDIVLFLNKNKAPQSIDTLQNQIWKYEYDLETHTVETHIYRLRKKIKEIFNDDNFINSLDGGYSIK